MRQDLRALSGVVSIMICLLIVPAVVLVRELRRLSTKITAVDAVGAAPVAPVMPVAPDPVVAVLRQQDFHQSAPDSVLVYQAKRALALEEENEYLRSELGRCRRGQSGQSGRRED